MTFLGNRYWTFRHRERTGMGRETIMFFVLNGVGLLIQQACLAWPSMNSAAHDKLSYNAAFLVGIGLATLFRFWSYRKWVWLAHSDPGRDGLRRAGPSRPARHRAGRGQAAAWRRSEPTAPPANGRGGPGHDGQGQAGQERASGPRHARPR